MKSYIKTMLFIIILLLAILPINYFYSAFMLDNVNMLSYKSMKIYLIWSIITSIFLMIAYKKTCSKKFYLFIAIWIILSIIALTCISLLVFPYTKSVFLIIIMPLSFLAYIFIALMILALGIEQIKQNQKKAVLKTELYYILNKQNSLYDSIQMIFQENKKNLALVELFTILLKDSCKSEILYEQFEQANIKNKFKIIAPYIDISDKENLSFDYINTLLFKTSKVITEIENDILSLNNKMLEKNFNILWEKYF